MKKTCVLLSVLALNDSQAQLPPAIRIPAYSGMHGNIFAFTGNQAALATAKNLSAGLYAERKFMLPELSQYTAGAIIPTTSGNFGLTAGYSGNIHSNNLQFGLAYGRHFGKIDAGVQFNYHGMQLSGYGSASGISFDAGVIIPLTERLRSGLQVQNPIRSTVGKSGVEILPVAYATGLGYDISEKIFIGAEMRKVEENPIDITTILRYQFAEELSASIGTSTGASSFFLGAGLSFSQLRLEVLASMHPQLGITPALILIFPK